MPLFAPPYLTDSLSSFSDDQFFIAVQSSENNVSPDVLILNVSDNLQDVGFLNGPSRISPMSYTQQGCICEVMRHWLHRDMWFSPDSDATDKIILQWDALL